MYIRFLKIRGEPRQIAYGLALGIFIGMTPFMGLHTIMALFLAAVCKRNKFAAVAAEPFALFFEPPSMDDRIVNQFALFSILTDATARLDGWLLGYPDCWRQIIIPASLKWEIRDKLDQSNITERVLFPGLDGLSRWLRRQYSPKKQSL